MQHVGTRMFDRFAITKRLLLQLPLKRELLVLEGLRRCPPDRELCPGVGVLAPFSGQSEVSDLGLEPLVQHDVPGGQVAMNDLNLGEFSHSGRNLQIKVSSVVHKNTEHRNYN